ncbi:hypothetical protein EC973_005684 [Apophysomyces ossiformis]|uniref:Ribonuclease P/MRP protein subunit POP5 n=1 Tax=Apophysomyces ossiformis TaxID=679940 RepID=A0A8H7BVY7_9FUNG|nr:hypothetical protein EC973_005684 [Apophysomyces ossiformis]
MVRLKNRWILFELVEDPVIENNRVSFPRTTFGVTEEDITTTIRQAINMNYGDFGSGMVWSAGVKWYNPETRMGILRVPRDYLDMYLATLFFIKAINNLPCSFQVHHVSGTIIFIQKTAIQRDADLYLEQKMKMEAKGKIYSVVDKIEASERQIKQICDV